MGRAREAATAASCSCMHTCMDGWPQCACTHTRRRRWPLSLDWTKPESAARDSPCGMVGCAAGWLPSFWLKLRLTSTPAPTPAFLVRPAEQCALCGVMPGRSRRAHRRQRDAQNRHLQQRPAVAPCTCTHVCLCCQAAAGGFTGWHLVRDSLCAGLSGPACGWCGMRACMHEALGTPRRTYESPQRSVTCAVLTCCRLPCQASQTGRWAWLPRSSAWRASLQRTPAPSSLAGKDAWHAWRSPPLTVEGRRCSSHLPASRSL